MEKTTLHVQQSIESKLREALTPEHLEVLNESGMHAVAPGSETHFRVVVVAAAFAGKPRVAQHRMIYEILAAEREEGVHALGIQTFTPAEYEADITNRIESPPCAGGDGTLDRN
jgi:BolA protein